jgi:hypothetical protein
MINAIYFSVSLGQAVFRMRDYFFILPLIVITTLAYHQDIKRMEKESIQQVILDYYHEDHALSDNEKYISRYKPGDSDKNLNWNPWFYYIDISGNIAVVKIRIANQKFGYIDYFNLIKEEDTWWIVNKITRELTSDEL